MPFIPVLFSLDGKVTAEIAWCTQKEYDIYLKNQSNAGKVYVSFEFLQQYLIERSSFKIKNPLEVSTGLAEFQEHHIGDSMDSRFVTVDKAFDILVAAKLVYDDFIDAYAAYLKIR